MAKIIKVEDTEFIEKQYDEAPLRINEEFEKLFDSPSEEDLRKLEKSLVEEGCRQPIDIWKGQIIDGHSRHKLCKKNNICFKTRKLHFDNEEQAKLWILQNQDYRRNLKDSQRSNVSTKIRDLEKKVGQKRQTDICTDIDESKETGKFRLIRSNSFRTASGANRKLFRYNSLADVIDSSADDVTKEKQEALIFPDYDDLLQIRAFESEQGNFPQKEYSVVYADFYQKDPKTPEWQPKILLSRIKNIPMKKFLAKDAVTFLWTPISHLENTLNILKRWGVYYRTTLTLEEHNEPSIAQFIVVGSRKKDFLDMNTLSLPLSNKKSGMSDIEYFRGLIQKMHRRGNKLQLFIDQESKGWDKYQQRSCPRSPTNHL